MTRRKKYGGGSAALPIGEFIEREIRQLTKLLEAYPELTVEEIAERLAETPARTRKMLRILRKEIKQ